MIIYYLINFILGRLQQKFIYHLYCSSRHLLITDKPWNKMNNNLLLDLCDWVLL